MQTGEVRGRKGCISCPPHAAHPSQEQGSSPCSFPPQQRSDTRSRAPHVPADAGLRSAAPCPRLPQNTYSLSSRELTVSTQRGGARRAEPLHRPTNTRGQPLHGTACQRRDNRPALPAPSSPRAGGRAAGACPQPPRPLLPTHPGRGLLAEGRGGAEQRGQLQTRSPPRRRPAAAGGGEAAVARGRPLPGEPRPRRQQRRRDPRPAAPGTLRRKFIYRLAGYVLTSRSAPPPCVSVRRT